MSDFAEKAPAPSQRLTDREQLLKSYAGSPLAKYMGSEVVNAEVENDIAYWQDQLADVPTSFD